MLRTSAIALAAVAMLGTSAVSAQTIDLGGRGGPSVDLRSERQRERDFQREEGRSGGDFERRGARRDRGEATGSLGRCREITIRERDEYGRMQTRTREECR